MKIEFSLRIDRYKIDLLRKSGLPVDKIIISSKTPIRVLSRSISLAKIAHVFGDSIIAGVIFSSEQLQPLN